MNVLFVMKNVNILCSKLFDVLQYSSVCFMGVGRVETSPAV